MMEVVFAYRIHYEQLETINFQSQTLTYVIVPMGIYLCGVTPGHLTTAGEASKVSSVRTVSLSFRSIRLLLSESVYVFFVEVYCYDFIVFVLMSVS